MYRFKVVAALLAGVVWLWWVGPTMEHALTQLEGSDPAQPTLSGIVDVQPPSTILPPGTTSFALTLRTADGSACGWALNEPRLYHEMASFVRSAENGQQTAQITGLNPEPTVVNDLFIRCQSQPDDLLHLFYRARSDVNPAFPRVGNLWGIDKILDKGVPYLAQIDLWIDKDDASLGQIDPLRQLNPHLLILTSFNAVDNSAPIEDYYLHDVNGKRIEIWPGYYRLNLTKPDVVEFQARAAYRQMEKSGMRYDGIFFDNVMTTQSWLTQDVHGKPIAIDANEDRIADDPAALDAAWKTGVFAEMRRIRQLLPNAILMSHSASIDEPGVAELFNGSGVGFATANVLEGERRFSDVWTAYHALLTQSVVPPISLIEASPIDQIAYGYNYSPGQHIPSSTLEFARTYYPWMRFGLVMTLMNNGYFAYEFGDAWHGNDWRYDEFKFDLGYPIADAQRVELGFDAGLNRVRNGNFEADMAGTWEIFASNATYAATAQRDLLDKMSGTASVRLNVSATGPDYWRLQFAQSQISIEKNVDYQIRFWAKADRLRSITLSSQKSTPNWESYGLWRHVDLDTTWRQYSFDFTANATANDARLQFLLGGERGTVWLDDVVVTRRTPDVYQRLFSKGMVLFNASRQTQTVAVGAGWRRYVGNQAPYAQQILDDLSPHFRTTGDWSLKRYDSGERKTSGPYYHAWNLDLHELSNGSGEARWELPISFNDLYTLQAWWPDAPTQSQWSNAVRYEVLLDGQVVASKTLDQTQTGDQWHEIASIFLNPDQQPTLRLICPTAPCVADAIYLYSQARYNDGSTATTVTLSPMDGILLQRTEELNLNYHLHLPIVMMLQ